MSISDQDIDAYFAWLRERTRTKNLTDGWTEITTPYLDRHNNYIQLYGRRKGGKIELSDDGATIADLEASGCEINTEKRRDLLKAAARGHGIEVTHKALRTTTDERHFALKLHSLAQAVLAVDDLFYLSRTNVSNIFFEDVVEWLTEKNIRYVQNAKLSGKSGFDHHYDFIIPSSREAPERLVSAINRPTRLSAERYIFSWLDTSEARAASTRSIAIINDANGESGEFIDAVEQYDIETIRWSEREGQVESLAA